MTPLFAVNRSCRMQSKTLEVYIDTARVNSFISGVAFKSAKLSNT